jgi:hypothetical protein
MVYGQKFLEVGLAPYIMEFFVPIQWTLVLYLAFCRLDSVNCLPM